VRRRLLFPPAPLFLSPSPVFRHLDGSVPLCSNEGVLCGRTLAVDYGMKSVGLAYSDELGVTIQPLPSVPNRGRRNLIGRLKAAVLENNIGQLVVGVPWNMDGSSGEGVRSVERLMETLRLELGLPVQGMDERLSSVEATELWNQMSARQRKRYRTVDSLAAALILTRFLGEK